MCKIARIMRIHFFVLRYFVYVCVPVSLFIFSNLFPGDLCFARIIYVPADSTTIQAAIKEASDGDTVMVDEGVCFLHCQVNDAVLLLQGTPKI